MRKRCRAILILGVGVTAGLPALGGATAYSHPPRVASSVTIDASPGCGTVGCDPPHIKGDIKSKKDGCVRGRTVTVKSTAGASYSAGATSNSRGDWGVSQLPTFDTTKVQAIAAKKVLKSGVVCKRGVSPEADWFAPPKAAVQD